MKTGIHLQSFEINGVVNNATGDVQLYIANMKIVKLLINFSKSKPNDLGG